MDDGAVQASLVVLEEGVDPTQFAVKVHFEREAGEDEREGEGEYLATEVRKISRKTCTVQWQFNARRSFVISGEASQGGGGGWCVSSESRS